MPIISTDTFKAAIKRGKFHHKSPRLNAVVSSLDAYNKSDSHYNFVTLHTAVNLWAKKDPKEFLNTNFVGDNAVYILFAEVNAEFYARCLGPFEFKPLPKGLVFIPFGGAGAMEFRTKSQQWNDSEFNNIIGGIRGHKIQQYEIVEWMQGLIHREISNLPDTNAEIFIRGHGSPGATHISTRNSFAGKIETDAVSVADVCQRLIDSGLKKSFSGNIHFYCCHSAVDALAADIKEKHKQQDEYRKYGAPVANASLIGDKSIARIGAAYMRSHGYGSARYFGYLGPLVSLYSVPEQNESIDDREIDRFMHRYVNLSYQGYKIIRVKGGTKTDCTDSRRYRARVACREV